MAVSLWIIHHSYCGRPSLHLLATAVLRGLTLIRTITLKRLVCFFRELQLGGTVCIETKSKNGKRLMRRVRVVNRVEHLQPYLKRVCEVLGCCSELISGTRYPLGYCNQTCCLKGEENPSFLSLVGRYCFLHTSLRKRVKKFGKRHLVFHSSPGMGC